MHIITARKEHHIYARIICATIAESANTRGTGIAKRSPSYIIEKMEKGDAIIALDGDTFAGFSYIEAWGHEKFVANSGLIVYPTYRNQGLARKIKDAVFYLSRKKYPDAKIFSITTGLAVMKLNYQLGYRPVTFSELTDDADFWNGCQTCPNYDILQRNNQKMCLCTGMLYDPKKTPTEEKEDKHPYNNNVLRRLRNIKKKMFLKKEG